MRGIILSVNYIVISFTLIEALSNFGQLLLGYDINPNRFQLCLSKCNKKCKLLLLPILLSENNILQEQTIYKLILVLTVKDNPRLLSMRNLKVGLLLIEVLN